MHLDRRVLVTIRSGYARFEHDNGSFRSRPAKGVNSPVALPRGYLGILKLAINPIPCSRIIGDSWSCKGPVPFGVLREARSRFRVFGGADSTAPPSGCARHRNSAPQQIGVRSGFRTTPPPQNSRDSDQGCREQTPTCPPNCERQIVFSSRNMASQDELKQVGLEVCVVLEEPMVQDTTPMQELSPQRNPEGY